jgi:hypothetical protein
MIKARRDRRYNRRDRRYRLAMLETLEQRIVLNNGTITLKLAATLPYAPGTVAYQQPDGGLVVSSSLNSSTPAFVLVNPNGTNASYSNLTNIPSDPNGATVRAGQAGGWTTGDLFSSSGTQPGQILKITSNGNTVINPWVTLSGETALGERAFTFDRTGIFGGDLIIISVNNHVWRINAR